MNENSNKAASSEAAENKVITNYNLIILDRSGSMGPRLALGGCSTTLCTMCMPTPTAAAA